MKKIIKLLPILLLVFAIGCDEDDTGRFNENPTTGYVDFYTASTTTGQTTPSLSIPLHIAVPVYQNGLSISYSIEAVEGDFTQFVESSSGTVFADPSNFSRAEAVNLELMDMEVGRDFVTIFDVVITAVDQQGVTIGLDDDSITSHRVTIPCSNPDVLPAEYFVGDYSIVDVNATIGPGNGTSNFAPGTVTLSVDPLNPNGRLFESPMVPAFTGGAPFATSLVFSEDDVVTLGGFVGLGISCNQVDQYGFDAAAAEDSVPWDVCNDTTITIEYVEDPLGSCGGPFASSFTLTKL